MRSFVYPTRKNRVQVAALVLFVVALVIPQLAWADHASDHPYSQFDDPALVSAGDVYATLVEKYKSGELVYNAPGRRDDRSFSIPPSASWTIRAEANPGMDVAQWYTPARASLAVNPELMAFRRYAASQQAEAAAASSARWVALGNYYMEKSERAAAASSARWIGLGDYYADGNEVFLAANPEIMTVRRFVQDGCSALGQAC